MNVFRCCAAVFAHFALLLACIACDRLGYPLLSAIFGGLYCITACIALNGVLWGDSDG